MTSDKRKVYNREKQRFYRTMRRGKPARPYVKTDLYVPPRTTTEEILRAAGHCPYCGILLSSEWHDKHPLVGCMKAIKEYKKNTRKP